MALSTEDAAYVVDQFGIDIERPLLTQISRFDPWKDPLGVIDAYRIVKEQHPAVQLALVGSMAHDDPEGWDFYNRTVAHADGDPDIFILSNLNNIGSVEVNAFQVHSAAVIQKSIKRGLRADGHRGALEGAADGRRAAPAGSSRRSRTARPGGSSIRPRSAPQACLEIMADPAAASQTRAAREGVRAAALPHAASAARLARAVQPPRRQRHRRNRAA